MAPERRVIETAEAPAAIGPYSQAIRHGDLLFCSGQLPLDPSSGELVKEGAAGQVRRCLENLQAVCRAAGTDLGSALRLTLYLSDMRDFQQVNEVYAGFFSEEPPARVAVQAAALPRGADVEVDAVVALA